MKRVRWNFIIAVFAMLCILTGVVFEFLPKEELDKELQRLQEENKLYLKVLDERIKILEERFLMISDSIKLKLDWIETQKEINRKIQGEKKE